ncbi:PD-(D/E)XK motif protein [Actinoplanes awajinensis]|uniref:PD-(D/E)XK motif protein n=1 Tax=Actinoplanes awajinensis subsp. mycoplanecinus TaxID=135947 RepID=A0A101JQU5_9ACTN|nr:PD-(D/E)XK motif protein [Actinoplanes awajinensis]KUL31261.1 hypothetical protein ADL15_22695 [Actinoplanes awajinensis subsp. mycoplanecinus]
MIDDVALRSALQKVDPAIAQQTGGVVLSMPLGRSGCRIGRDAEERVILVVPAASRHALRLRRLEYRPRVLLTMSDDSGATWQETTGLVACNVATNAEQHVLLGIFTHLVNELDQGADVEAIGRGVEALRSLFAAMRNATQREEIGLWGELLVIAHASDPILLAEAWGSDPLRVFDFAVGNDRLEVKTTASAYRQHIFSLPQLEQSATSNVVVVSIVTSDVGSGTSVLDLLDRIDRRLRDRPDLRQAVLHRAVNVAGETLNSPRRFDETQALITARILDFSSVPQPQVPDGIVNLSWTVRLSSDVEDSATAMSPLARAFRA